MLKKIVLGGLFVAFAAVLIAGALNRTAARSVQMSGHQLGQTIRDDAERSGRNGPGSICSDSEATGQVNVTEWQAVTGTVSGTDASRLEVTLDDGSLIEVGGRAADVGWTRARLGQFHTSLVPGFNTSLAE
jgi:hypothetical protein